MASTVVPISKKILSSVSGELYGIVADVVKDLVNRVFVGFYVDIKFIALRTAMSQASVNNVEYRVFDLSFKDRVICK